MDSFTTVANCRKRSFLTLLFVWLAMSTLALLGLKIAIVTCLFFEIIILITCLFSLLVMDRNSTRWRLEFEEDSLRLTSLGNKRQYEIWETPVEDFVLTQTKAQCERDCGDLRIQNTVFHVGEVQNFAAMKQYIETHF